MKKKPEPKPDPGILFGGQIQTNLTDLYQNNTGRPQSRCHICNYWTPEHGCKHYLPATQEPTPIKYESVIQRGLFYWAEPNDIDGGKTFCVICQVEGYPATEGHDDWFGSFRDADAMAKLRADGII